MFSFSARPTRLRRTLPGPAADEGGCAGPGPGARCPRGCPSRRHRHYGACDRRHKGSDLRFRARSAGCLGCGRAGHPTGGRGGSGSPRARPPRRPHRSPREHARGLPVALGQGADGVELDVHRTADDAIVVHHDAEAAAGRAGRPDARGDPRRRPDIPTLAEVLDVCAGSLVNIEIKNLPGDADYDRGDRRPARRRAARATRRRGRRDRLVVQPRHDRPGPRPGTRRPDWVPRHAGHRSGRALDLAATAATTRCTRSRDAGC